ncbi:hypothetical protein QO003_003369 [Arthrobacter silviterrae]|uniref:RES family NAD+ phosphorylase n=1 Tax=Arthrobacter silviterrae TaxID=2026658 RepID=A0ABX0DJK3_9MICC|nr:RES family NAD+ phosphorylase [Arthrobacter silviterrae]MDQ0279066.1 hypothetical protein [Arthrobacter silviterrae]NGN84483.1 RES family NAD+ phosphorylase [Arthrobacter silviterrae]
MLPLAPKIMISKSTCKTCFGLVGPIDVNTSVAQDGICSFCNDGIVDIWPATTWADSFSQVLDLYRLSSDGVGDPIHIRLQDDWTIFNPNRGSNSHLELLRAVFPEGHPLLSGDPVIPISNSNISNYPASWDDFAIELTSSNRFFPSIILDPEILRSVIHQSLKSIQQGTVFFRGRICRPGQKLAKSAMGAPPKSIATGGRANPPGISHLYLSFQEDACISECRPSTHDVLSIAKFQTVQAIEILDLSAIQAINPFAIDDDQFGQLYTFKLLKRLGSELSRPVRRSDNGVEYVASQYLCEFVKSLGISGIKYSSSVHPGGLNLVLFNESLAHVTGSVKSIEVCNTNYILR